MVAKTAFIRALLPESSSIPTAAVITPLLDYDYNEENLI